MVRRGSGVLACVRAPQPRQDELRLRGAVSKNRSRLWWWRISAGQTLARGKPHSVTATLNRCRRTCRPLPQATPSEEVPAPRPRHARTLASRTGRLQVGQSTGHGPGWAALQTLCCACSVERSQHATAGASSTSPISAEPVAAVSAPASPMCAGPAAAVSAPTSPMSTGPAAAASAPARSHVRGPDVFVVVLVVCAGQPRLFQHLGLLRSTLLRAAHGEGKQASARG